MSSLALNIHSWLYGSQVSGPGKRDLIWVQGCSIGCQGCFNKHLWSYEKKHIVPVDKLLDKFWLRRKEIEGITLLGGEPTEQAAALAHLLKGIKAMNLSTVIYTGRIYEDLLQERCDEVDKLLDYTDILIDGPYKAEKYQPGLLWRGSINQRILFLSDHYSESVLEQAKDYPGREYHVSLNGDQLNLFKTGIKERNHNPRAKI